MYSYPSLTAAFMLLLFGFVGVFFSFALGISIATAPPMVLGFLGAGYFFREHMAATACERRKP
jgi:hypothetical protein